MEYEVSFVVVKAGKGSSVIKYAKQQGVTGATVFLGTGSVDHPLLKFLELSDIRKEIIMMVTPKSIVSPTLKALSEKFHFDRPNKGIAFSIPLEQIVGIHSNKEDIEMNSNVHGGKKMLKAIFTIVDRGKAETVIDSANRAGAKGATIINGRGSGIHEHATLFSIPIEPEKEIVMIIIPSEQKQGIIDAIRTDLEIEKPGKGILFVLNVNEAYGLS